MLSLPDALPIFTGLNEAAVLKMHPCDRARYQGPYPNLIHRLQTARVLTPISDITAAYLRNIHGNRRIGLWSKSRNGIAGLRTKPEQARDRKSTRLNSSH